jgi:hypothetical protein
MDNLPDTLSRREREEIGRKQADATEAWIRRIIDFQMTKKHGPDYFNVSGLINSATRKYAATQRNNHPNKFIRDIDATTLDQAIDIVCNHNHFREFFEEPLRTAYPLGERESRHFLTSIRDIRNDIAHGRGCSARQLEKIVCYSNDLIDALMTYFQAERMGRTFNVPYFLKFTDNVGNSQTLTQSRSGNVINLRGGAALMPGQMVVVEVEVDPTFPSDTYSIAWEINMNQSGFGSILKLPLEMRHVGEKLEISITVKSNRPWHRFQNFDDFLVLEYCVLPPQE